MRLTGDKGTSTARCVLQSACIWFYFVVLHMRVAWKTVRGNDTVVINTPVASVKPRSHRPNWTGLATVDPVTPSVNRHAHRTASRDTDLLRTDCLQVGRILRELHLVRFECGFSEHDQNLQVAPSVARSLCDSRDLRRCGIVQTGYAGHGTVGRAKKLLDERAGRWVGGSLGRIDCNGALGAGACEPARRAVQRRRCCCCCSCWQLRRCASPHLLIRRLGPAKRPNIRLRACRPAPKLTGSVPAAGLVDISPAVPAHRLVYFTCRYSLVHSTWTDLKSSSSEENTCFPHEMPLVTACSELQFNSVQFVCCKRF